MRLSLASSAAGSFSSKYYKMNGISQSFLFLFTDTGTETHLLQLNSLVESTLLSLSLVQPGDRVLGVSLSLLLGFPIVEAVLALLLGGAGLFRGLKVARMLARHVRGRQEE